MPKAILFDADGVTLKKSQGYFSDLFAKEYNAPLDKLRNFFKTDFKACQEGRADLKEALSKDPTLFGEWKGGVDEFLHYWFTSMTEPDHAVLAQVAEFKKQGIECYLTTDQERYRAEYIRTTLGFANYFDQCFFSYELGHSKSEPEYFTEVLTRINKQPAEVAYFDDDPENVAVASSVGIKAIYYQTIDNLKI